VTAAGAPGLPADRRAPSSSGTPSVTTGLPAKQGWWTVKRQAFCADGHDPVGIYFGTTSGEVWGSNDEGASFKALAQHLPLIHAVEAAD